MPGMGGSLCLVVTLLASWRNTSGAFSIQVARARVAYPSIGAVAPSGMGEKYGVAAILDRNSSLNAACVSQRTRASASKVADLSRWLPGGVSRSMASQV